MASARLLLALTAAVLLSSYHLCTGTSFPEASSDPFPSVVQGSGFWSTRGSNFVDAAGRVVYFSGVIWSGFETPEKVVHGLWGRSYGAHLDQMKALGFNLIRLPFSGEALLPNAKPVNVNYYFNPDLKAGRLALLRNDKPVNIKFFSNSDLKARAELAMPCGQSTTKIGLTGLNSIQVMDKVIAACTKRGIKVILDYHRIHATVANELGLWYDDKVPQSVFFNNWIMLAKRYKGNPTIIGADLFNEVHSSCPGCPTGAPFWQYNAGALDAKYNWRTASFKAAKAIHAVEPNWIIFLEGLYHNYWWGGNVASMLSAPITLPVRNKLAYSVHEYGPYVFFQAFFNVTNFPNNLIPLYRKMWGRVQESKLAPVWIGEFGSFYPTGKNRKDAVERTAFVTLIKYIRQIKASWTIAFWGPDSKDTGGILKNDWNSVDKVKVSLLQGIMHPNFGPSTGQV